jgi:hypothetical protein
VASWETCWAKCCNSKDAEWKLDLQSEHPKELVTSASKQDIAVSNKETEAKPRVDVSSRKGSLKSHLIHCHKCFKI